MTDKPDRHREKMAKKKAVKTEAQVLDPGAQYAEEPEVQADEAATGEAVAEDSQMVKIKIPVMLKIKRQIYNPGFHSVPMHMARTMSEMVDKKRRADISIFVGKNVLVERLMDRTLVQTEVENLDIKKIVNR